jgi:hypothetical protein
MQIFVFGNPDIAMDSLPLTLMPKLAESLPEHTFTNLDPNEDWDVPRIMVIIDTVVGLEEPRMFEGFDHFMKAPRMTCHDFDAYANLLLLKKLGKIDDTTILGLPPGYDGDKALSWLTESISSLSGKKY